MRFRSREMSSTMFRLTVALAAVLSIPLANACSPPEGIWTPPTTIEQVQYANVVLYGKVERLIPDRNYDTAYSAVLNVYCVLRGEQVPQSVIIRHAGYMPGMCTATNLEVNGTYVLPLYELSATGYAIEQDQIEEVLQACNFNPPTYPLGVDESNADIVCPTPLPPGECKEH